MKSSYQKSASSQGKSPRIKVSTSDILKSISIVDVIQARGVELSKAGPGRWRASCPFHAEKTPSFFVYQESNRYHCFGCQESGDVIDFVMKLDGLCFLDTVERLTGQRTGRFKPDPKAIRKRQAGSNFRKWLSAYSSFLGTVICGCKRLLYWECRHPDDLDRFAGIIDLQSMAQLHLDAIIEGNRDRITEVFRQFLAGEMNYV